MLRAQHRDGDGVVRLTVDKPVDKIVGAGLVILAAARLTRFVTSDTLGEWMFVGKAKRWAWRVESPAGEPEMFGVPDPYPTPEAKWGWRSKLVHGLDCPFCVGFWIGGLVLLGEVTIGRSPLRPLWRFGLTMLGMNYLVGHLSSRIDG